MPFAIGKLKYWKARKLSPAHKLKIRKAMSKPDVRKKLSEGIKRAYSEGKLKKIWKDRHLPLAMREKISETKKKQTRTPEYRKKTSRFFKRYWKKHPEEHKQVMDKTINLWKKDKRKRAEISKKISLRGKMRFSNPAERLRMRKAVKEYWRNHPNLDEIWSLRMYLYYAFHRKARNRLLKNDKNPFKPHLKTKQGFLVRSKGERTIANALHELGEKAEYETHALFFPEDSCVPDFWLPERNKLIEFYGGYPKSWKKKVIKNKLYKKYGIPVIAITPAELLDIKNVLGREFKKDSSGFDITKFQNPLVMADKREMKLVLKMFPKLREYLERKGIVTKDDGMRKKGRKV